MNPSGTQCRMLVLVGVSFPEMPCNNFPVIPSGYHGIMKGKNTNC
jgi:hypothetical protein